MLSREAIIYINSRLLAVSMQIENSKSKDELKKLRKEHSFLLYARGLVYEKLRRNREGKL